MSPWKTMIGVCLVALAMTGCSGTHTYVYGSQFDTPGPGLVLWPADESGASWRYVIQSERGLHPRAQEHTLDVNSEEAWRLGDGHTLTTMIAILPPEPGPELRAAASTIEAGLSSAYPAASLHLLRANFDPVSFRRFGSLQMGMRDIQTEHLFSRPTTFADMFRGHMEASFLQAGTAEIAITPITGDGMRFAAFAFAPGTENGFDVRAANADELMEVFHDLLADTRGAWAAAKEDGGRYHAQIGRVRACIPEGTSPEARSFLIEFIDRVRVSEPLEPEYMDFLGLNGSATIHFLDHQIESLEGLQTDLQNGWYYSELLLGS